MPDAFASFPGFLRSAPPRITVSGREVPAWASTALIAVTFVLCTVHTTPFADLQSVSNIEVWDGGSLYTQIGYSLLFVAALGLMNVVGLRSLVPLARPAVLVLAGWIALSTVLSQAPVASARRLALTFVCIFLSAALLLVARSVSHFARTLALTAFGVLILSYVSLVAAPTYALHTSLDLREPELAGDWRGPFNHKNEAGAVMVLFVFVGLLAWQTGRRWLGLAVGIAATIFLVFTRSKTALALLPMIVLQVSLARIVTGTVGRLLLLLGPVIVLGVISLGSFFLQPLQELLAKVMDNTSFTGRTEIWDFALDNIGKHPITGWGYGAFWRTEETQYASWGTLDWLSRADQAHNAYLDTALFMGFPGLVLTLYVFVVLPFRDLQNAAGGRQLGASTNFFVGIWLYALCTAFFESIFYEGNSAIFLLFTLAIFGLRYQTLAPTVAA